MAWIDDRIWCHPKLVSIPDNAFRVYVNSIAYSSGMGLGGHLDPGQQKLVGSTTRIRATLVARGLWDENGDGRAIDIHDWKEHNEKRDERRRKDRERKKAARESAGTSAGRSSGHSHGTSAGTAHVDG
jgi:hypothetical protein